MSDEMKKIRDELIDHIDKALVNKAEQIPSSWSPVMKGVQEELRIMNDKIAELDARTRWIQDTFAGGKIISKVSTAIVKFLIFVSALSGFWICSRRHSFACKFYWWSFCWRKRCSNKAKHFSI